MKILLINPKWHYTLPEFIPDIPAGLGILAAVLRNAGYKVQILDINGLGLDEKEVETEIQKRSFDIVGAPVFIGDLEYLRWLTEVIHRNKPGIPIILGGPLVSTAPAVIMNYLPLASMAVIGEGEDTIVELLEALNNKGELKEIKGIMYRGTDGKPCFNHFRLPPDNLNDIPFPAWDLFPMERYLKNRVASGSDELDFQGLHHMTLITSRGCPFRCSFCAVPTMFPRLRYYSIEKMVREIEHLKDAFQIQAIWLRDDTFTVPRERTIRFCKAMSGLKLFWGCTTRTDSLDQELLKLMKESGCRLIRLGIESFSQTILDISMKKATIEQNLECIRNVQKAGIQVGFYAIIGLPGETRETLKKTEQFAEESGIKCIPYLLIPLPGSPLYKEAKESGKIQNEEEYILRLGTLQPSELILNLTDLPDQVLQMTWSKIRYANME